MKTLNRLPEFAIAVLALVLRVYEIFSLRLTTEEGRILLFATDSQEHLIHLFKIGADIHSGASFPYLVLVKMLPGTESSPLYPRLLSIVCGLISIAFIYALAKRLFGLNTARLSALFLAILPFHILASRTVAMTMPGFMIIAITLYLFHRIYEGDRSIITTVAFALVYLAGINFHYYTIMLFIPLNILYIGFTRKKLTGLMWWIPLNALIVLCAWFWFSRWTGGFFRPSMTPSITSEMMNTGALVGESLFNLKLRFLFLEKYITILYQIAGFFGGTQLLNGWSTLGVIFIPIVYHYFPFIGFREYEDGYRSRAFAFFILTGLIIFVALLSFSFLPSWDYILPTSAIFFIVCSHGAVKFAGWRARSMLGIMILCMLLGFIPTLQINDRNRPDWDAAIEKLYEPENMKTLVVFIDGTESYPVLYKNPLIKNRALNLFRMFDLTFIEGDRYRQEELEDLLAAQFDMYPSKGGMVKQAIDEVGTMWVFRNVEKGVMKPKHTHEYEVWLNAGSEEIEKLELGGDMELVKVRKKPDDSPRKEKNNNYPQPQIFSPNH